jgi:hypothetical protein
MPMADISSIFLKGIPNIVLSREPAPPPVATIVSTSDRLQFNVVISLPSAPDAAATGSEAVMLTTRITFFPLIATASVVVPPISIPTIIVFFSPVLYIKVGMQFHGQAAAIILPRKKPMTIFPRKNVVTGFL